VSHHNDRFNKSVCPVSVYRISRNMKQADPYSECCSGCIRNDIILRRAFPVFSACFRRHRSPVTCAASTRASTIRAFHDVKKKANTRFALTVILSFAVQFSVHGFQYSFSQTKRLGCHFYHFIIVDKLQSSFESQGQYWCQYYRVIFSGGSYI